MDLVGMTKQNRTPDMSDIERTLSGHITPDTGHPLPVVCPVSGGGGGLLAATGDREC